MHDVIFDTLIDIMLKSRKELRGPGIPEIYYVGLGRTGSASIKSAFPQSTAHWHSIEYFEKLLYKNDLLSKNKLTMYHFIKYIGNKHQFKPLIIECIRDPIARVISVFGRRWSTIDKNKKLDLNTVIKQVKDSHMKYVQHSVESLKWKDVFGVDLLAEFDKNQKYFYKETEDVKLVFLRFEDIKERGVIFKNIGYDYNDSIKLNDSTKIPQGNFYMTLVKKIKFSEVELNIIYDGEVIHAFYTDEEIENFKKRWRK
jgi:hypothetical protein